MPEFLTQLLQAVIAAAIPVCGAYLIKFLNQKSAQIAAETDSVEMKNLIEQVNDAVTKAVTYTTQTFVDSLKKNGIFDAEAQAEALQKSLDKTMALLSEVAKSALEEIREKYGFEARAIVSMAEVTEYLYQKPYKGKIYIDDAQKAAIDAYYEQYGAR